jgi:hypothetical protein
VRDIWLARVPPILRVDVYAVVALAGSAFMIAGLRLGMPQYVDDHVGCPCAFSAASGQRLTALESSQSGRTLGFIVPARARYVAPPSAAGGMQTAAHS